MTFRALYSVGEIEKMRVLALKQLSHRFEGEVHKFGRDLIESRNHAIQFGLRLYRDKIVKYGLKETCIGEDAPPFETPGFSSEHLAFDNSTDYYLTRYDFEGVRLIAKGGGSNLLHSFLLQYRQPGVSLPSVRQKVFSRSREPDRFSVVVERDIGWALKLLLPPIASRAVLVERLREADAARLAAWGSELSEMEKQESYVDSICFESDCYRRYAHLKENPGNPLARLHVEKHGLSLPSEPPVATHDEIVAWLHNGGRIRRPISPSHEVLCTHCLIDRKDGSWSIYGWNDADGPNRYPPEEVIRYYDESMAYEFLLNAALGAVV